MSASWRERRFSIARISLSDKPHQNMEDFDLLMTIPVALRICLVDLSNASDALNSHMRKTKYHLQRTDALRSSFDRWRRP